VRRPPVEYVENPKPLRSVGLRGAAEDASGPQTTAYVDDSDEPIHLLAYQPDPDPHALCPPNQPGVSAEWVRRWPFIWHACQDPERPIDEAISFASGCEACEAEWDRRGCPVAVLPPLPADAPVYRQVVGMLSLPG
jgi:hypothetical protein